MYGLLLENIHDFFKRVYGVDIWRNIRKRAGIRATSFVLNQSYPETFLLRISTAACEYTGETQGDLMYDLGVSLLNFYMRSGYEKVLKVLGRNIASFMNGLDNVHEYYRYKYPKIKPPSFSCQEESSTGITVRYRSKRPGFLHMVRGLLKQLSKQFFEKDVKVEVLSEEVKLEENAGVTLVHFRVHYDNTSTMLPAFKPPKNLNEVYPVKSKTFFKLFPFHIVFGRDMVIFKVGLALQEVLPELLGERVNDVFFVVRPQHIEFTWDNILLHSNNIFELISDSPVERRNVALPSKEKVFSKSNKPRGVKIENIDSTTVKVKWNPPKSLTQQQQIHGYQVYYQKVTPTGEAVGIPMRVDVWNTKTTEISVSSLEPGASYAVQVVGYTKLGEGERSEAQVATTLKAPEIVPVPVDAPELKDGSTDPQLQAYQLTSGDLEDDSNEDVKIPSSQQTSNRHKKAGFSTVLDLLKWSGNSNAALGWSDDAMMGLVDKTDDVEPSKPTSKYLGLKGQMKYMPEWDAVLFVGTPVMENLEDLFNYGLYLTDLCMHDCTREMVINGTQPSVELKLAVNKEAETNDELTELVSKIEKEKKKADELLYSMIPKAVADRLRNGEPAVNDIFQEVSVLFCNIVGFTDICSRVKPMELVTLLNDAYTIFDNLTEQYNVFKVETIGDEYMIESGAPIPTQAHAFDVADMSLAMLNAIGQLSDPCNGETIKIRIGMNSGPVVAGVVGLRVPRYCLFGDTVNTASRMESTGAPMTIQITGAARRYLKTSYIIEERGLISVKGKGKMKTYWLKIRRENEDEDAEFDSDSSDSTIIPAPQGLAAQEPKTKDKCKDASEEKKNRKEAKRAMVDNDMFLDGSGEDVLQPETKHNSRNKLSQVCSLM
ncbi:PREDICTED: soluble guanylate cyclase gcy-31-like [Branchiostoma belcheri]|uniref:guanylate cyclase n=1 Tax=Branchiostoma belcheri TaxID=7741 RepID=A0A6P4YBK4_BRABE|nr:PREDICTED: soluble guanylate cyclase gcy-31-like [Branchiostoma belcheri]